MKSKFILILSETFILAVANGNILIIASNENIAAFFTDFRRGFTRRNSESISEIFYTPRRRTFYICVHIKHETDSGDPFLHIEHAHVVRQ